MFPYSCRLNVRMILVPLLTFPRKITMVSMMVCRKSYGCWLSWWLLVSMATIARRHLLLVYHSGTKNASTLLAIGQRALLHVCGLESGMTLGMWIGKGHYLCFDACMHACMCIFSFANLVHLPNEYAHKVDLLSRWKDIFPGKCDGPGIGFDKN